MGNYVIAVGNYVIVSPSELGNCVIADSFSDWQDQGIDQAAEEGSPLTTGR
jgi:hypothetical protein